MVLPTPLVPNVALSGFAFSQAISSFRLFAGSVFLAAITCELVESSEIGAKSFTTSYGSGRIAQLMTCVATLPRMSV